MGRRGRNNRRSPASVEMMSRAPYRSGAVASLYTGMDLKTLF